MLCLVTHGKNRQLERNGLTETVEFFLRRIFILR